MYNYVIIIVLYKASIPVQSVTPNTYNMLATTVVTGGRRKFIFITRIFQFFRIKPKNYGKQQNAIQCICSLPLIHW